MVAGRLTLLAAALVLTGACGGEEPTTEDQPTSAAPAAREVRVENARVLAPSNPERTALYAELVNPGTVPDTLLAISSPAAEEGSIHEMYVDGGMMRMRPIESIAVPVGATVVLAPGQLHGMLEGGLADLTAGATVEVTLTFAKAGEVTVQAEVIDPADAR